MQNRIRNQLLFQLKIMALVFLRKKRDKIYSRFYRISNVHTQQVKGSGIGLTIVKQIIESHGGTISLESKVGSGSTFIIKLPILK